MLADEQSLRAGPCRRGRSCRPARFRARRRREPRRRSAASTASTSITLSRSSVEPFLQFSARRDLREKAFRAWIARGDNGGTTDNKAIIAEMVRLRAERAQLLGYADFAALSARRRDGEDAAAVRDLLDTVWAPARARALADRDALQALVQEEGGNFALAPWDWRYYAEKLRKERYDLDEAEIKPYLQLDRMIEAAFDTAHGCSACAFRARAMCRSGIRTCASGRCADATAAHVGLFFGDYFARALQAQRRLDDRRCATRRSSPATSARSIVNVMNFSKAAGRRADAA